MLSIRNTQPVNAGGQLPTPCAPEKAGDIEERGMRRQDRYAHVTDEEMNLESCIPLRTGFDVMQEIVRYG